MVWITRFPFFFWWLKSEPDVVVEKNYIVKGDKRYEIKKSSVWIFLFAKYFFVLVGLTFVFSKFDFVLSAEKLLQYATAIVLTFLALVLPKRFANVLIAAMVVFVVVAIVFGKLYFVSFAIKYCIVFLMFFMALSDSRKTHYYLLNDNKKIIANVITEEL
ncbi:MAG: hypothetical protein LBJ88_04095 [Campylobacteraceae bacterium]|jgi:sensor histidine kinase YesM|nr:hypothetical protein [Campylobacteraceae bacterium]